MCGGGGVQDNSDKVAKIQADAAEKARLAEEEKRKQDEARFNTSLNGAYTSAIEDARNYFAAQGLNPDDYMADITSAVNAKKGVVPFLDSAPGTYFTGTGQQAYTNKETGMRNGFLNNIDRYAGQGFEKSLISDTSDDSALASILNDAYGEGQQKLDIQKQRGVLTDAGFAEAMKELTRQKSGASTNLDTIGQSVLETGRGKLRNTAADARTAANAARLGGTFDPFAAQKTLSDETTGFFATLADKLRGSAPTDLFDVSKAFTKGGVAQGPGNYGYDPDASSGMFALFDDQAKKKNQQQQVSSPF